VEYSKTSKLGDRGLTGVDEQVCVRLGDGGADCADHLTKLMCITSHSCGVFDSSGLSYFLGCIESRVSELQTFPGLY
jgi:hypothetical protein